MTQAQPTVKHVILADSLSVEQRDAIQSVVKEHARGWWHRFPDVWIVGGGTAKEWRDRVKPFIGSGGASVLVITLPSEGRRWAYFGPDGEQRMKWLHSSYS